MTPEGRYWKMSNANPARRRRRLEQAIPTDRSGCWEWPGAKLLNGYGVMRAGKSASNARLYVHRVSYETFVGPIPDGLQIDHLCRNRACFNPAHLEPVTPEENTRRGNAPVMMTHRAGTCASGRHEMTPANTYGSGRTRRCRACNLEWRRTRALQNRANAVHVRAS